MTDIVDDAQKAVEFNLKTALHHCRRDEPNAVATGFCLYCDEPIEPPRRWCNADCRDEWQRENQ